MTPLLLRSTVDCQRLLGAQRSLTQRVVSHCCRKQNSNIPAWKQGQKHYALMVGRSLCPEAWNGINKNEGSSRWKPPMLVTRRLSSSTAPTPSLRPPTEQDVEAFREMLQDKPGSVLTKADEIEKYNTDWTVRVKSPRVFIWFIVFHRAFINGDLMIWPPIFFWRPISTWLLPFPLLLPSLHLFSIETLQRIVLCCCASSFHRRGIFHFAVLPRELYRCGSSGG